MKKKVLICGIVIATSLIIVVTILIIINLNNKKINANNDTVNKNDIVENNEPSVTSQQNEVTGDAKKVVYEKIELIKNDNDRIEYSKKLQSISEYGMRLQTMLYAKVVSWQNTTIIGFNSGKFNDKEKFRMIVFNVDLTDSVAVYEEPAKYIDVEKMQNASQEIFEEDINVTNLQDVEIKDGKIKIYFPTGFGIELFRAKTLIYDEETKIYTLVFDWLRGKDELIDTSVLNYNKDDIIGTFELKYKDGKSKDSKVLLELNKI